MGTLNIIFLMVAVSAIAIFSLEFVAIQKKFFPLRKNYYFAVVFLILSVLFPIFDFKFFYVLANLRHYITLILFLISFWLIFKIKFINSLYLTSVFALIIYTIYIFLTATLLLLRGQPFTVLFVEPAYIYYLLYAITVILGTIIVYIIYFNVKTNKIISLFKTKHLVKLLVIINICLYFFMLVLANGHVYNIEHRWYNVLIIITCLLVILLYNYLLFSIANVAYLIEFKYQKQLLEKQLELQLTHYQDYQQYNEQILQFKHDYPGLYESILRLISDKKFNEALNTLEQMNQELQQATSNFIPYSNNYIVDALIRDYRVKFEQIGVHFSALAHLPEHLNLKEMDLMRLFTNLLDNAYEAVVKLDGRKIVLIETLHKNNWHMIRIKNSTNQSDLHSFNKRSTIKDDKMSHGWGNIIIDEIVMKANGFITREIVNEDGLSYYQVCLHFNPM